VKTTLTNDEFQLSLRSFTGTESWFRVGINPRVLYTEGVKYVADSFGAYWLLDLIATEQWDKKLSKEEFQVWKLKVNVKESEGVLTCEDGNNSTVYTKELSYTDFPFPEVTLWYTNNVILLPSEY